jgi:hypothetical protein
MPSGIINATQLPPIDGSSAKGGMMRQVDEMKEDIQGMDGYGVSHNCHILNDRAQATGSSPILFELNS